MKAVRIILTVLCCCLIAVGLFSVIGYELSYKYDVPTVQAPSTPSLSQKPEASVQEEGQTGQTEQEEETASSQQEIVESGYPEYSERALKLLSGMTLEQKVYQLFFVTPESITGVEAATRAGDATREALMNNPVGGLLYDAKNLEDTKQVTDLLNGTQRFLTEGDKIPAFLAIDEEGGEISPVANALDTASFAPIGTLEPSQASALGGDIAEDLKELGFNTNFAPIADLSDATGNPAIGTRSFGTDSAQTATCVADAVRAAQKEGIAACVSHFPGIGTLNNLAHNTRSPLERSMEELTEEELRPFRTAMNENVAFVMVSHCIMSAVDDQHIASMSQSVMKYLRETMRYGGIILTDVLNAPIITEQYSSGAAAVNAIKAGADMLLCPQDLDEAVEGILNAVDGGSLTEERINESVLRILEAKLAFRIAE